MARGSSDNAAVLGRYLVRDGRPPARRARRTEHRDQVRRTGGLPRLVGRCAQPVRCDPRGRDRDPARCATVARSTVGVSNERECPLRDAVDLFLCCDAGPELAVPATKTVTAQMVMMAMLAAASRAGPVRPRRSGRACTSRSRRCSTTSQSVASGGGAMGRRRPAVRGRTRGAVRRGAGDRTEGEGDDRHAGRGAVHRRPPAWTGRGGRAGCTGAAARRRRCHQSRHRRSGRPARARATPTWLSSRRIPSAEVTLLASVPETLHAVTATVRGQQLAHCPCPRAGHGSRPAARPVEGHRYFVIIARSALGAVWSNRPMARARAETGSGRRAAGGSSARSLLLTVLGEFVLPQQLAGVDRSVGGRALAELGIEEKSARQALSRLAAEGLLVPQRLGRRVQWQLTASRHRPVGRGHRADLRLRPPDREVGRSVAGGGAQRPGDPTPAPAHRCAPGSPGPDSARRCQDCG